MSNQAEKPVQRSLVEFAFPQATARPQGIYHELCRRCGNDEWHVRRNRRTCSVCRWEEAMPEAKRTAYKAIVEGAASRIVSNFEPPVFCGTTGDKDRVKEKATARPQGIYHELGAALKCSRCHRLVYCDEATAERCQSGNDGKVFCQTCTTIAILDSPPVWRKKEKHEAI